jgi:adenine-specific DNA-methyltransferase
MDRLKMHSVNKVDENIKKIAELFPNTLTEVIKGYRNDGTPIIEHAIDFDMLRQELSDIIVEGPEERYQFTWPDKKKSILLANAPIAKTLRPCREESVDFDTTENLYIEGDNLDALKLLQETYLGKVKMIYIDPPYNTGNDFVYEDDFAQSADEYLANSGQFDEDGNRLVPNPESNGRFHTDWLNMMYPRLKLAKDLLSEDGVIFISIDDNEVENLKKICNEVFGESNFIGNIVWEGNGKNDSRFISETHEYIVIYSKSIQYLKENGIYWRAKKDGINEIIEAANKFINETSDYYQATEKLRAWYSSLDKNHPSWKHRHYNKIDKRGVYFPGDISAESGRKREPYMVLHPITKKPCKMPTRGFPTQKTMEEWINADYIDFGPDETCVPKRKRYLFETDSYVISSTIYKDSRSAYKNLISMFGAEVFDNPKDDSIIRLLCEITTSGEEIILDFFSGSATTAHAVMQLNAEDGGNRKFIMVQLPEPCGENSEAFKAGYKNICEIGKERIRRAGKKILEEHPEAAGKLDTGFRVLKVDSTNMQDVYYRPDEYTQDQLSLLADNIKPDRTPEDLLFQVMLDLGVLLSSKIEETVIGGKKVFNVADGYLMACFDNDITDEVVREIAKRQPYYAVFRDSGMASDSVAANFEQIFETYSPSTVRKVL